MKVLLILLILSLGLPCCEKSMSDFSANAPAAAPSPQPTIAEVRAVHRCYTFIDPSFEKILIVVNGIPFKDNVSTLDPNTIERISVLKGEEAERQFGNLATYGAIVIETKQKKKSGLNNTPSQIITFKGCVQRPFFICCQRAMGTPGFLTYNKYYS